MYYSKNNILVKIEKSNPTEYALLNPLTGSFDLMNEAEYQQFNQIKQDGRMENIQQEFIDYLLERGYLFATKAEEDRLVQEKLQEFNHEIENSQVQLLLIPTYGCNLACTYCYQQGVENKDAIVQTQKLISPEMVDAFFAYAEGEFSHNKQKPFVTLFGGEPLVNSPAQRRIIEYIVSKCKELDYELAAVTNGYDLIDYVDLLSQVKMKEIQVTLDGSKEVHDQRRGTANGKGTFERIVAGMEAAIQRQIPINFRTVVDNENLQDIVNLAQFLDEKGWLDLGQQRFKTQIGRNYELFECYAKPQHLLSQVELWGQFARLSREYPVLQKLHRPDFKGIRQLVDTGEMYMPSFDTCPATKTEWVFDLNGEIYGCTANCGREEFKLGTYYPEVTLHQDEVAQWQKRNVETIPECRDCQYNVVCGGGCGVVAVNKNGHVLSPDCRPIQELMEIGINHYIDDIKQMAEVAEYASGCLLCGEEIIYHSEPITAQCAYCGKEASTYAICKQGHYVCDQCHGKEGLELVESLCLTTELTDPVEIANQIFELPGVHMHGPEYHSIVPAAIVTAYGNVTGSKNAAQIKTAIKRGKEVNGGFCGTHGACGAAVGAGIAYSVLHQVNPLSKEARGTANRFTAHALLEMSEYGGPRCCKRETMLAIKTVKQNLDAFKGLEESKYVCRQFKENKDCIKAACPFFPKKA